MKKSLFITLFMLGWTIQAQQVAPLWLEYQQAREAGKIPTLPDYSWAGYHFSEKEIPEATGKRFDVTDYGAIPGDDQYDDAGIQAAIDAAQQNSDGGIVFFPPGKYLISSDENQEKSIRITKSNIIIRGSGSGTGGTEIFMDKMRVGSKQFRFGPEEIESEKITEVTMNASRETYWIEVADASQLKPGRDVVLTHRSEAYTRDYFAPKELSPVWTRLFGSEGGMQVREIHTIETIEGNKVKFRNPLHLDIKMIEGYPFELRTYTSIQECGVEDILFTSNWKNYPEEFVHHKDGIHDGGWTAIGMENMKNSWIRRCTFRDWNEAIALKAGYQVSFLNIRMTGKKGHTSIHARSGYGVLIKNCDFNGAHHHGPGTGYGGCGTVVTRCTLGADQIIDSHSGQPYATLFDDILGGVFYNLGGPNPGFPHHGKYLTFWNFRYRSEKDFHYNFWSLDKRKNYTIAEPIFAGFQPNQEITFENEGINQLRGVEVSPTSLFEAQLELRLSCQTWQSGFVKLNEDGSLTYIPDEKGNTIPDFSRVGYHQGDKEIPEVPVRKTISPAAEGSSQEIIQQAIDELALQDPDKNGFRGAILLKKGTYLVPGTIRIVASGIVLFGEGDDETGTRLVATGTVKRTLLSISGNGSREEILGTRRKIADDYVPVGATSFALESTKGLKAGDNIILYRPGTANWIADLKMDQIVEREGTRQWRGEDYSLSFERVITGIRGNTVFIDNPVVMSMEAKYGGGEIYKYSFEGRISEVGVENILFESEYESDTAENHGWTAIEMDKVENGWVRNVTSRYFGYSCVSLGSETKQITVMDSKSLDSKSIITGGRRYSFNNNGQLNLFMNLLSTEGRHDFVTGARVCGPNAFVNCTARNAHSDIGPHHRWATGTLYDNIDTDGAINVQDRGYMGSGHGWAGVTQVIWNCKAETATVQSPWVSGRNYSIGLKGIKKPGWLPDRPDGKWEGNNKSGLVPRSLYETQLKASKHSNTKSEELK